MSLQQLQDARCDGRAGFRRHEQRRLASGRVFRIHALLADKEESRRGLIRYFFFQHVETAALRELCGHDRCTVGRVKARFGKSCGRITHAENLAPGKVVQKRRTVGKTLGINKYLSNFIQSDILITGENVRKGYELLAGDLELPLRNKPTELKRARGKPGSILRYDSKLRAPGR
jgi:hypothetical protein